MFQSLTYPGSEKNRSMHWGQSIGLCGDISEARLTLPTCLLFYESRVVFRLRMRLGHDLPQIFQFSLRDTKVEIEVALFPEAPACGFEGKEASNVTLGEFCERLRLDCVRHAASQMTPDDMPGRYSERSH
jgi:hypothetical protein